MTQQEFNTKYKNYIEEGFYGLSFDKPKVTEYLDKEFSREIEQNPDFQFSQIKVKFGYSRVYTNCSPEKNQMWEKEIQKLI